MQQFDRGVPRDTWSRNNAKELGDSYRRRDGRVIIDATTLALERGSGKKQFLGSIRIAAKRGLQITKRQLDVVNGELERLGLSRVSVEVYDKDRRKRRWEHRERSINSEHAALAASRPLKPPGGGRVTQTFATAIGVSTEPSDIEE